MDNKYKIYDFAMTCIDGVLRIERCNDPNLFINRSHIYRNVKLYKALNHRMENSSYHTKYHFWFRNKQKNLENFKMLANLSTSYYCGEHNFDPKARPAVCERHFTECLADFCCEMAIFALCADKDEIEKSELHAAMCIVYALSFFERLNRFSSRTWSEFSSWGCGREKIREDLNSIGMDWNCGDDFSNATVVDRKI